MHVGKSSDTQPDIFIHLRIYIHMLTPGTAAISPPTTVIVITRAKKKEHEGRHIGSLLHIAWRLQWCH